MIRRKLLGLISLTPLLAQQRDLESEFTDLMNRFIIAWNDFCSSIIKHGFDVKAAQRLEDAWGNMTRHPGWLLQGRKNR